MNAGKCRECNFSIHFVKMRTGKTMPVDTVPDERGNVIALKVGRGRYIDGYVENPPGDVPAGNVRLMCHFATCAHPKNLPKGSPRPTEATTTPALFD